MKFLVNFVIAILLVLTIPKAYSQVISIPIPGSPLSLSVQANPLPLQNINTNPNATAHNLGDDGWANVPLPFNFPFYGQSFNQSTMYSNGAVQFGRPVTGWPSWNNSFCCQGQPLTNNLSSGYNYSIMPLWTDLVGYTGNNHYSLGTTNTMTYGWYDVAQYGRPNNKSNFELKIDSGGGIDMRWSGALVTYAPVTIGTIGDASKGEYTQNYYSSTGINLTGLTQLSTGADPCYSNPLSSPSCPGYAEAFKTQQCTISALYDSSCPGYATAYLNYQCSVNPLYSTTCSGYAEAYKTQQCSLDGLYDRTCPNYSTTYATRQLTQQQSTTTTTTTTTSVSTTEPTPTISSSGTVSTDVAIVSDSNVNQVITSRSTSTDAAASAAPVNVVRQESSQQSSPTAPAAVAQNNQKQEDKKQEQKTESGSGTTQQTGTQEKKSEQTKTARQELQEKREAAAKKDAVEKGKDLANEMGKAANMEQQIAVQNVVIQAMGFTPGFDVYNKGIVPDGKMYKSVTPYANQRNVDNARLGRGLFGATDRLHNEMVESQYGLK